MLRHLVAREYSDAGCEAFLLVMGYIWKRQPAKRGFLSETELISGTTGKMNLGFWKPDRIFWRGSRASRDSRSPDDRFAEETLRFDY